MLKIFFNKAGLPITSVAFSFFFYISFYGSPPVESEEPPDNNSVRKRISLLLGRASVIPYDLILER